MDEIGPIISNTGDLQNEDALDHTLPAQDDIASNQTQTTPDETVSSQTPPTSDGGMSQAQPIQSNSTSGQGQGKPKSDKRLVIITVVAAVVFALAVVATIATIVFVANVGFLLASEAGLVHSDEQQTTDESGSKDSAQSHDLALVNSKDSNASNSKLALVLSPLSDDEKEGCILGIDKDGVLANDEQYSGLLTPQITMTWMNNGDSKETLFLLDKTSYLFMVNSASITDAISDSEKLVSEQDDWSLFSSTNSGATSYFMYHSVDSAHKLNLWVQLINGSNIFSSMSQEQAKSAFTEATKIFSVYYYDSNDQIISPIDSKTGKATSLTDYHFYNDLMSIIFRKLGLNTWDPSKITRYDGEGLTYVYKYEGKTVTYKISVDPNGKMPDNTTDQIEISYHGENIIEQRDYDDQIVYYLPSSKTGVVYIRQLIKDDASTHTLEQGKDQFIKDLGW